MVYSTTPPLVPEELASAQIEQSRCLPSTSLPEVGGGQSLVPIGRKWQTSAIGASEGTQRGRDMKHCHSGSPMVGANHQ